MIGNQKSCFKGIIISIIFYVVSSLIGALFNVLISITSGYDTYAEFTKSDNYSGFLLICLVAVINHIVFALVTVKMITKVEGDEACESRWLFPCAAISVLLVAVIVIPLITDNQPGWLTWATHFIGILLFGREKQKRICRSKENSDINFNTSERIYTERAQIAYKYKSAASSKLIEKYCYNCGKSICSTDCYCPNCGKALSR